MSNLMAKIYYDPDMTADRKRGKFVKYFMDPYKVDILLSGIISERGDQVRLRVFAFTRTKTGVTPIDLSFGIDEFSCAPQVICDNALYKLSMAVDDLLERVSQ